MAQTIKLKRSAVSGAAGEPSTTDLALGEIALNTTDGKLFIKKSVSGTESILEIGSDKLPLAGGAMTGAITTNSTFDTRTVSTDGTKLDTIETNADVTDAANVTAAGALMDSELTAIASVKALNQGVATGDSPTFAALTSTGEITANGGIALGDNDKATFGASDDLQIYHDGSNSYIKEIGTGDLTIAGDNLYLEKADGAKFLYGVSSTGQVRLYYGDNLKLMTTATGIDVTGTVTATGVSQFTTLQVTGSALLRKYASAWTEPNHDVLYNGWTSAVGDYTYLKTAGNSAGPHGMIMVGDNTFAAGNDNLENGVLGATAIGGLTNTFFYANTTGLTVNGTVTATGGNSGQWNTAYTYSQVGHLPLTGGTLTASLYAKADFNPATQGAAQLVAIDKTNGNLRLNIGTDTTIGANGGTLLQVTESGVSNARDLRIQPYGGQTTVGIGYSTGISTHVFTSTTAKFTTIDATGGNSGQWNTAYGWGDHASAGYTTSAGTTYTAGTGLTLTGQAFSLTDTNAKLNLSGGTLTGDLTIPDKILHAGDTDTYIQFGTDTTQIINGGVNVFNTNATDINMIRTLDLDPADNTMAIRARVDITDAGIDSPQTGIYLDMNISGTTALTADRAHYGLRVDLDSSNTGGNTTDENRIYGAHVAATNSGDADLVYGGHFTGQNSGTQAGTLTNTTTLTGVMGYADQNRSKLVSNMYGTQGYCVTDNAGATGTVNVTNSYGIHGRHLQTTGGIGGTTTNAHGVYGEVECNEGVVTNAYGVRSVIDHNAGVITTGYLFHGAYTGTLGTKWGIYIGGATKNRISGQIEVDDGTAALPTITNTGDTDTGIYFPSANQIAISTGATHRATFSSTGLNVNGTVVATGGTLSGALLIPDGTNLAPSIANTGDTNTGIYFPAENQLALVAGNAAVLKVEASGTVLSGWAQITTAIATSLYITGGDGNSKNIVFRKATGPTQQAKISAVGDDLRFTTGTTTERMRIDSSGRLLLNATTTAFNDTLYVNGNAYTTGGWRVGSGATYSGKMYNNSGILSIETDTDRDIRFGDVGTPAVMYIDTSTENVGIGTTSPYTRLDIKSSVAGGIDMTAAHAANLSSVLNINHNGGDGSITIKNHHVGAGNSHGALKFVSSPDGTNISWSGIRGIADTNGAASTLAFFTANGNTQGTSAGASSERMRIDINGNVGIGNAAPATKLHVSKGSSGFAGTYNSRTAAVIEGNSSAGTVLSIMSTNTGYSGIFFGDAQSESIGQISFNHANNSLKFYVNGGDALLIDNAKNVLIGKTTTSVTSVGIELRNNGLAAIVRSNATPLYVGRTTSDGSLVEFRKDTTVVGTIGVANTNNLTIGGSVLDHGGLEFGTLNIMPKVSGHDLGVTTRPFGALHLTDVSHKSETATLATVTQTSIATFAHATYGAAKFIVTAKDGVNRQITEILVTHNGTTAIATEYGTIVTSGTLAAYDVDISGANVRLLATSSSTNSTVYKIVETLIEA